MKHDVNDEVLNGTPKTLILSDGVLKLGWDVKIKWKAKGEPCYTFLNLDRKTYDTKLTLEMFIYI
jgi:hypothetical protein